MADSVAADQASQTGTRLLPKAPGVLGIWLAWAWATLLVIVVYVWYVSVGYWTWWPKTTYTYDLLGSALRAGQLSLQQTPDPALLALPDPYDPSARLGLQYPWDASLYAGRYYLYWGPTPGLFLALIKLVYAGQIADQYLVFAFVLGTYAFSSGVVLELWKRHFRDIPVALAFVSFLAVGLAGPATWILNRPAGYEAAITGGQALFSAGLFLAMTATGGESSKHWRLLLAGICWALAVGSRVSTIFPIAIMTMATLATLARKHGKIPPAILGYKYLLAPLAGGGALIAWYNWDRFGSIWEFGLRYQLTLLNLHALYNRVFSIQYIVPNLYNYLLNPVGISRVFPFLTPLSPAYLPPGPALGIAASDLEPVTGLLFSAPWLLFSLMALPAIFSRARGSAAPPGASGDHAAPQAPIWLHAGLLASATASFLFVLIYFYPTARQLDDVVPIVSILAAIGLWEGWRLVRARRLAASGYGLISLGLIAVSILSSSLLAVTSYENRFQHLHRELLRQLIGFFGR